MALLGKGARGESIAVTVERLWAKFRGLENISKASVPELTKIRGIGSAKAVQIRAASELARRLNGNSAKEYELKPFVKWAGGKNQLLSQYARFFPPRYTYNTYFEPMVGGGAVFFYLRPESAILSDLNRDLINTYIVIKNNVENLIKVLNEYKNNHDQKFYYQVRDDYNSDVLNKIERTAAFIYLNKTGFNGLYRVNSKGEFNVPSGKYKNPGILDEQNLRSTSKALKHVKLYAESFEKIIDRVKKDDFIYFDPPYYPLTKTAKFTTYTSEDFLEKEQAKLADIFRALDEKGCKVMLSNSNTKFIKDLYKKYRIETVSASRFINCDGSKRGKISELVIMNY
ncbi:MAG: adenine methylase protein [Candidatus Jorgensenbacteria bacterium GW2011_GWC1_48_8]|nr:MAG: adenine methylase protein [Candidatus Jorgensenbacteria bacterium GW2011_GWC1_48_8]